MWADRDSTKPLPPRGTAHTLWAGTAGVKAVSYSKSLAHRQALPLLLSCLHTLLTPRGLDQGPGGLPAAWTLVRPQPPGLRSGYPSKAFPHLPHQVKCYLSLEACLKSFLCLLSSSVFLPVSPGILHFPGCRSVCVEFLQLPAPGRGPVSSLLLPLLPGLRGSLHPPGHSLARILGMEPVTGT